MENKVLKKVLVMAIVFVIVFSNCGITLQALATSDGLSVFGFSLFAKKVLNYKAYFLDENGNEVNEMSADVNGEMTLVFELEPKTTGYLKTGTIKAVTDESEPNFEFKEVLNLSSESENEDENLDQIVQVDQTLLKSEQVLNTELPRVELNDDEAKNTTVATTDTNTVVTNTVTDNSGNTVSSNTVAENTVVEETVKDQENLVDENTVYQEEVEEKEKENALSLSSAQIISSDEIEVQNVVESTKIYVKLVYKAGETVNVSDLYQKISLEFTGTYINEKLEEVAISAQSEIKTEWTYTKDIVVSGEITKVSPFEIDETKGTLVESTITVRRDCTEENYLPIKESVIELEAPQINGKTPTALDVSATKLKATRGEEINEVTFSSSNWTYDENKNTITIKVENTDNVLTSGEDIFKIIYRYDEYVESEEIQISLKGSATVEEYTGRGTNQITKEIASEQNAIVNVGELITYSIGTTDDEISRGKINANYNSEEAVYETEFTSTVSINILTNDVLEEFTLKDTKEYYIDNSNVEFETQDVKYKAIKFKYDEIYEMLEKGGTIEIKANTGELLYTLNSSLIKSQENCELTLNGDVRGVEIYVKNVQVNGTITVDFEKSIGKCSYEKSAFNSFEKIESRIKAEVKYGSSDEVIELAELKTDKYFADSYTRAELSMSKTELSTLSDNEDVEIKIELNNAEENSDLYINPEFEIVFPSYVQDVEVRSINLLYEEGLSVKNITLFKDSNNVQRMRIQLEGVQRQFSTSTMTNGTNVIVNTKIVVDDYTPKKVDQIKMYYFNQGVTNYQAQTDWKISSDIPEGILKTTNGFDVQVFSFQAPSGFITANGIENYDGLGSKIETIKQGEITAKAEMGQTARIATMNLAALNNTGNECTDVVMIGRIPSVDSTDVITGEKLGTTTNTQLVTEITQADSNPIGCDIYYSYKADATQTLSDPNNGWEKTVEDMSQVKSFLIIPTSAVEPGTTFKFSYNFQVPANLPYEVEMYGNFGAYYNNHSDVAIIYESTKADLVGLVTDAGPRVESSLSVNIGNGADVQEGRILTYTVTARNTGTMSAKNIVVNVKKPSYTVFTQFKVRGDIGEGDYAGYYDSSDEEKNLVIDSLEPGEAKEVSFMLRVATPLTKVTVYDEDGNVVESEVDENQDYSVSVQANINVENLSLQSTTNTVTNKIVKAKILTNVFADYLSDVYVGYRFPYIYKIRNISGSDIDNLQVVCKIPTEFQYEKIETQFSDMECTSSFDEETNTLTVTIPHLDNDEDGVLSVYVNAVNGTLTDVTPQLTYKFEDGTSESGQTLPTAVKGAIIQASLVNQTESSEVLEGDKVEYKIRISNIGKYEANKVEVKLNISKNLENVSAYYIATAYGMVNANVQDGEGSLVINHLAEEQSVDIIIEGTAKNLDKADGNKINNKITASYVDIDRASVSTNEIIIKENPNKVDEDATITSRPIDYDEEDINSENNSNSNTSESNNSSSNTEQSDSSSNSSNNDNNNSSANNTENNTSNNETTSTTETTTVENVTYTLSGYVWVDENKNGQKDDEEKDLTGIEVQLYKGSNAIKATQTNINGRYVFTDLSAGTYSVHFVYNGDKYIATTYKKTGVDETANSDAVELSSGYSLSNNITIENSNIENLNLGLQYRDTVDFSIQKVIKSAKVITKKGETTHEFENLELAKFEIASKELNDSTVELVYQINITNNGNAEGQVTQLIDYLPKDATLVTENNDGWYLGNDGNAYNDSLKDISIVAGETRTLNIKLVRTMTEENTGVLENKVVIASTYNKLGITENTDNNTAVQETIISVKTGYVVPITIFIVFIGAISIISNLVITKKIKIDIKNFKIHRIYK
jgi:uncharacterized repeat protein (TIGR01451 family)